MAKLPVNASRIGIENVHAYLYGAQAMGLPPSAVQDVASTVWGAPLDELTTVSPEEFVAMTRLLATATGDPDFGLHVGEKLDLAPFGVMGMVMQSSSTLRDAIEHALRFQRLLQGGGWSTLTVETNYAFLRCERTHPSLVQESVVGDQTMATFVTFARWLVGSWWNPVEMRFAYPARQCLDEYHRIFRVPVHFGAPMNEMVFLTEDLSRPIAMAKVDVLTALADRAVGDADACDEDMDVAARARAVIARGLARGHADVEQVSSALGMSVRSLQRKLAEHGTSFAQLLIEEKKAFALEQLANPRTSVAEVAFLLGYSEPSAFFRAFRRWTGKTPREFTDCDARPAQSGEHGLA